MPMQVFTVGQVLAAADVNEYLVNTRYAVKAADTSRASNTTLTADPDLTLAVDASKSYAFQAHILFTAVNSTGDLKYSFTVPAGTVFDGTVLGITGGTSTVTLGTYQSGSGLITATASALGGGAVVLPLAFSGVLQTGGSAGSFTLNWAQNASNVTATVVKQGSYMFLRRVS